MEDVSPSSFNDSFSDRQKKRFDKYWNSLPEEERQAFTDRSTVDQTPSGPTSLGPTSSEPAVTLPPTKTSEAEAKTEDINVNVSGVVESKAVPANEVVDDNTPTIKLTMEELIKLEEELAESYDPNQMEAPPISDQDKQKFEGILAAENVCLIAGFYQDKPASIMSFFSREADGSVLIYPVAVMVTPEMAAQLKDDIGRPLPIL